MSFLQPDGVEVKRPYPARAECSLPVKSDLITAEFINDLRI